MEYDKYGRMLYDPKIHFNQCKSWSEEDLNYLVEWLDKIGIEEMSFALGRTENTIMNKACQLRKKGIMMPKINKVKIKKLYKSELK